MDTVNIITDKFIFWGKSLAKINGKCIFIPFSMPNEHLEVEITKEKRDYSDARIVKILKPSPHRVNSACPYYEKCGGCNMMHIDIDYQRELKAQILKDEFSQNGVTLENVDIVGGKSTGYRCRFQLNDGGLSERASNERINIEKCLIAEDEINSWLCTTPIQKRPKGRCHIFGSEKVVSVGGNNARHIAIAEDLKKTEGTQFVGAKHSKIAKKIKNSTKKHYEGTVLSENNIVEVEILGKKIRFDARGFFQSNLEVLEMAIEKICEGLSGKNALDIYAGCGTFSVFLSDIFENVTLIEHNRDALVFAEQNLLGKNHISFGISGAKWAEMNHTEKFDVAVIDPPRSGMEKEVLNYLCNSNIPDLRCLSCDPATQARDISRLIKFGYKIKRTILLDFYPNTSHIESLVILER